MAKIYYNLIGKGAKTIEQVPMLWRADVQAMLDADEKEDVVIDTAP